MRQRLQGVFTALVTPFTHDGRLDVPALRRTVRRQIEGGVTGLVPAGTTGEAPTLHEEEYEELVRTVVEEAAASPRKIWVIAGAGSNDTEKAGELGRRAAALGADALLVVTPYYNKPPQAGLQAHFRAVADASGLPLVLYNVPGRTGVNLLPATVLRLAAADCFWAVKEASGNLDQLSEIARARPASFAVMSGDDSLALAQVALGADGVISVVSNLAPALMVEMIAAGLRGDRAAAMALHARLFPLMRACFVESNPIPVKWAMGRLGLMEDALRLPLVPLSQGARPGLEEALGEAGLLAPEPAPAAAAR